MVLGYGKYLLHSHEMVASQWEKWCGALDSSFILLVYWRVVDIPWNHLVSIKKVSQEDIEGLGSLYVEIWSKSGIELSHGMI